MKTHIHRNNPHALHAQIIGIIKLQDPDALDRITASLEHQPAHKIDIGAFNRGVNRAFEGITNILDNMGAAISGTAPKVLESFNRPLFDPQCYDQRLAHAIMAELAANRKLHAHVRDQANPEGYAYLLQMARPPYPKAPSVDEAPAEP